MATLLLHQNICYSCGNVYTVKTGGTSRVCNACKTGQINESFYEMEKPESIQTLAYCLHCGEPRKVARHQSSRVYCGNRCSRLAKILRQATTRIRKHQVDELTQVVDLCAEYFTKES